MVEKEKVVICDDCKEKIAKHKCEVCNKDLCGSCFRSFRLDINDFCFNQIYACENCKVKGDDLFRGKPIEENKENFDKDNRIKKIMLDRIKKNLIIENLKDKMGTKQKIIEALEGKRTERVWELIEKSIKEIYEENFRIPKETKEEYFS